MFFPEGHIRVYLYGHLFVLANQRATQIKVLYFERSGWCVWSKRLEAGRFISDWGRVRSARIDCTALKLMLEGIEVNRRRKRYEHPETNHADPCQGRNQGNRGGSETTCAVASG